MVNECRGAKAEVRATVKVARVLVSKETLNIRKERRFQGLLIVARSESADKST